jgi:hypothetical protein
LITIAVAFLRLGALLDFVPPGIFAGMEVLVEVDELEPLVLFEVVPLVTFEVLFVLVALVAFVEFLVVVLVELEFVLLVLFDVTSIEGLISIAGADGATSSL